MLAFVYVFVSQPGCTDERAGVGEIASDSRVPVSGQKPSVQDHLRLPAGTSEEIELAPGVQDGATGRAFACGYGTAKENQLAFNT